MNGLPYYKAYPRDFIEGTIGMSFELKGCYRLVLDLIYMQGGKLPDDARYISGLLGCSVRQWKSMREQLIAFDKLQVSGVLLTNYRALSELETSVKLQDKNRENAFKSNKINEIVEANATLTRDYTEPDTDREIESNDSLSLAREKKTEREKAALALSRLGIKSAGESHGERSSAFLQSCPEVSDAAFFKTCETYRLGTVTGHNPKFAPTPGEFAKQARCWNDHFKAIDVRSASPPPKPLALKTRFQSEMEKIETAQSAH
jgi:uncharacterized protein YdaU (DUF1376 family)